MISTESHTPKNAEKFKNLKNLNLLSKFKDGILQEISKTDQFFHFQTKSAYFHIAVRYDMSHGTDLSQI